MQVHVLDTPELRERAQALLAAHHYLGGVQAVGEQVHYAVSDAQGARRACAQRPVGAIAVAAIL